MVAEEVVFRLFLLEVGLSTEVPLLHSPLEPESKTYCENFRRF